MEFWVVQSWQIAWSPEWQSQYIYDNWATDNQVLQFVPSMKLISENLAEVLKKVVMEQKWGTPKHNEKKNTLAMPSSGL